jgi:hypothetical protein
MELEKLLNRDDQLYSKVARKWTNETSKVGNLYSTVCVVGSVVRLPRGRQPQENNFVAKNSEIATLYVGLYMY